MHHDIWEHDVSTPLVLYDQVANGRTRKLMAAMRTDGVMFYLDRETGTPVLPVEERPVTASVGVSTYPSPAKTADELIEMADRAMYLAKAAGRNRVRTLPFRTQPEGIAG